MVVVEGVEGSGEFCCLLVSSRGRKMGILWGFGAHFLKSFLLPGLAGRALVGELRGIR